MKKKVISALLSVAMVATLLVGCGQSAAPAEEAPAATEETAEEAPAAVTEDFRITVRKQLAALNKKCGYNRAAELINEQTGKGKLTEVALADLPKLMEAAKEETNAD